MILEPSKSAEEIDRRLSTINDPELAELLKSVNSGLLGKEEDDGNNYLSPSAPYWKRRLGLITLAGLLTMSAGYGYAVSVSHSHSSPRVKPHAAVRVPVPARHHAKVAVHHRVSVHHAAPLVQPRAPAPPVHRIGYAAPNEALIRQARAQLLHERALAAQARAETALAQHQAKLAMQAQAAARAQGLAEALAQARAEARAEAIARMQAQDAKLLQAQQQQLLDNASDPQIKPGAAPPPSTGRVSTNPSAAIPLPMPGPNDPNCTPHRGSLFGGVLERVHVGGSGGPTVGGLLRIIHP